MLSKLPVSLASAALQPHLTHINRRLCVYLSSNASKVHGYPFSDCFFKKVLVADRDIAHHVRSQVGSAQKGRRDVEHAKAAIQDLFAKINEIKKKAETSEQMVEEVCFGSGGHG